jgi:hypothetical protein
MTRTRCCPADIVKAVAHDAVARAATATETFMLLKRVCMRFEGMGQPPLSFSARCALECVLLHAVRFVSNRKRIGLVLELGAFESNLLNTIFEARSGGHS